MNTGLDLDRLQADLVIGLQATALAVHFFAEEARRVHARAFSESPGLEVEVERAIERALSNFNPSKGVLAHYLRSTVSAVVRGRRSLSEPMAVSQGELEALEVGTAHLAHLLGKADALSDTHRVEIALEKMAPADKRDIWALQVADPELRERILGVQTPVERVRRERELVARLKEAALV
jgi:hypothetical protein